MTQTPRLETIIEGAVIGELGRFWTSIPGRVQKFDQDTCLADVQPLVKRVYRAEDGKFQKERLPMCRLCPVMFQGGSKGQLTIPVSTGDDGLLVMTSTSLDNYLATGREVAPFDKRRNTLNDAVFFPGLHSMITSPKDYTNDAVVMRATDQLRLGGVDADEKLVLGTTFMTHFDAFLTAIAGVPTVGAAATTLKNLLQASLSDKVFTE